MIAMIYMAQPELLIMVIIISWTSLVALQRSKAVQTFLILTSGSCLPIIHLSLNHNNIIYLRYLLQLLIRIDANTAAFQACARRNC